MWNQRWALSLLPSLWTMNRTKGRSTFQLTVYTIFFPVVVGSVAYLVKEKEKKVFASAQVQATCTGFGWKVGGLHDSDCERGEQE